MGNALTPLSGEARLDADIHKDMTDLYQSTMSALALCAQQVPSETDALDEKGLREERALLDIQSGIINYVANAPIKTLEEAEALEVFWQQLITESEQEDSLQTHKLAQNIIGFYKGHIQAQEV